MDDYSKLEEINLYKFFVDIVSSLNIKTQEAIICQGKCLLSTHAVAKLLMVIVLKSQAKGI